MLRHFAKLHSQDCPSQERWVALDHQREDGGPGVESAGALWIQRGELLGSAIRRSGH